MDREEIDTSPNFRYSRFPRCQTQSDPLDSEDLPSTSKKLDAYQILLKKEKEKMLSVRVAELVAF
jgi:hypothetical protein